MVSSDSRQSVTSSFCCGVKRSDGILLLGPSGVEQELLERSSHFDLVHVLVSYLQVKGHKQQKEERCFEAVAREVGRVVGRPVVRSQVVYDVYRMDDRETVCERDTEWLTRFF